MVLIPTGQVPGPVRRFAVVLLLLLRLARLLAAVAVAVVVVIIVIIVVIVIAAVVVIVISFHVLLARDLFHLQKAKGSGKRSMGLVIFFYASTL